MCDAIQILYITFRARFVCSCVYQHSTLRGTTVNRISFFIDRVSGFPLRDYSRHPTLHNSHVSEGSGGNVLGQIISIERPQIIPSKVPSKQVKTSNVNFLMSFFTSVYGFFSCSPGSLYG